MLLCWSLVFNSRNVVFRFCLCFCGSHLKKNLERADRSLHPSSPDPRDPPYPIYHLCGSLRLVHWCLDHGAHVTYPAVEAQTPLLDHVALYSSSTVAVFKLLIERGAKLGRRTLHMAACSAARDDEKTEVLERKMEVVRFLVEEMGCDVDGMDAAEGEKFGGYCGTPVNYVAHGGRGGEVVVRYLLEVSLLGGFVLCGFEWGGKSDGFGRVWRCGDHG